MRPCLFPTIHRAMGLLGRRRVPVAPNWKPISQISIQMRLAGAIKPALTAAGNPDRSAGIVGTISFFHGSNCRAACVESLN
jgi:hypothetical protein